MKRDRMAMSVFFAKECVRSLTEGMNSSMELAFRMVDVVHKGYRTESTELVALITELVDRSRKEESLRFDNTS